MLSVLLPQDIFAQQEKKKKKKKKKGTVVEVSPQQRAKVDRFFVDASTQKMLGDLENALLLYDEVLKIEPGNHASHFEKSRIFLEKRSFVQAIESGKAAINGDKNNYWYHRHIEEIYTQQGDFEKAIETGEAIAEQFPGNYDDHFRLAELCVRAQVFPKAISHFKSASKRPGGNAEALIKAAELERSSGEKEEALATVESIIELMPSDPRAYELKVSLLSEMSREAEAKSTIQQWVQADPGNGQARLLLAGFEQGDEALKLYTEAFKDQNVPLQQKIGVLDKVNAKNSNHALDLVKLLNERYGNQPEINVRAGSIYLSNENYTEAAKLMREALKASPANEPAWENLLYADLAAKEYDQLKKDVEEALELYPNSKSLLAYYALWGSKSGDNETVAYAMNKISKTGDASADVVLAAFYTWKNKASSTVPGKAKAFISTINQAYQKTRSATAEEHESGTVLVLYDAISKQNRLMKLDPQFLTMYGHAAQKAGKTALANTYWEKARSYGAKEPEKAL